ncbi:CheR family methyltransferase [Paenibacillus eucommiae]|uniref:histidine kinase n=1 Tax=Paenibacillus eucommiae TaxID=1355755 RepID=A0ABS4J421_9BACL|nr:CheR family methyltransferase [Paenibacillus eucommiae]MBP1993554.1 two-component system CheB/CheR fusion protein [Paenibacillus eucommiae]
MNYSDDSNEKVDIPVSHVDYIVGIAASAMPCEGLQTFLSHTSSSNGIAYLIAQEQAEPEQTRLLIQQLAGFTAMPVIEAEHKMELLANCIYIIPPRQKLVIHDGRFSLTEYEDKASSSMPADRLFAALASSFGSQSIAIIFAGRETMDGLQGIDAVKKENGLVLVEHAAYSQSFPDESLPIKEQFDYSLSSAEMPGVILKYITFFTNHNKELLEEEQVALFAILKQASGVDFTYYKKKSILRRLQRRMSMKGFYHIGDYNRFLMENPDEVAALQKDFLIGVTHFFRDPEAFAIIAEKILPQIFEQRAENKQIRVWVAGCSTGEEVYSIAILIKQHMESIGTEYEVKIFATDLDKESIQFASRGVYPDLITRSVSPEHLKKYFTLQGSEYQVNKEIRQMIVFAQHNMLKDPPFIQLDLVTCRNMFIYLEPEMQRKVISLFHFALKLDAFLFLGPSETLGKLTNLFTPMDSKWNIYQYKEITHWMSVNSFALNNPVSENTSKQKNQVIARLKETERIIKLDNIYTKLLEEYVPACVIVDENNEIIHINGNASQYLIIPKGKPSHSLFKMIPEALSVAIGTALHKVRKEGTEVIYNDLLIHDGSRMKSINLHTKPFNVRSANDKLTIIFFQENHEVPEEKAAEVERPFSGSTFHMEHTINQHIKDLESELFHAKETIQVTIEELETSNEEYQAANEELIVANEELQSTNEELQSMNEELLVINNEYQNKIQELTEINTDMSNFVISTEIATLFLDNRMRIRKFTPALTKEINLMNVDIGRPFRDISHNLQYDHFLSDTQHVLNTGKSVEKDIRSRNGKWYHIKLLPYRTLTNENTGVVITFIDISELKKANEELLILSYAIQQSPGCIVITDLSRRIKYVNNKASETLGYSQEEMAKNKLQLHSDSLSQEQLEEIWSQLASGTKWSGELLAKRKNGEKFCEWVSLLPITNYEGEIIFFLKISEDITEQKNTLEILHKTDMLSAVGQLAAGIAHEIRNPLTALKGFTKLLEPSTDKKNYLQIMSSELDRIETVISELLLLARPPEQQFALQDITQILQDVVMLLETQAILKNVEIVTKFVAMIPLVNCVENQLKQVFINILKNGIESMPQGGILLVKVRLNEDKAISISFSDQGIGIPKKTLTKLGQPFYTTKENGTGLGLMVSYKIIANHQGTISIKSTLGKGTTVTIVLKPGEG